MKLESARQMVRHADALTRAFGLTDIDDVWPKLRRLEAQAHRNAERECSDSTFDASEEAQAKFAILESLDRLLGWRDRGIPICFNGDPRGYALKIEDDWVRRHQFETQGMVTDWGGYGILAPDF